MKKVILLTLILAIVSAGAVFAQDNAQDNAQNNAQNNVQNNAQGDYFSSMPKNAITVDLGPMIAGLSFGGTDEMIGGVGKLFGLNGLGEFADFKGFGIGAQYERNLMEKLSVAGRFAYMTMSMGLGSSENLGVEIGITSFSIEGHIRYYFDGNMFVDGMLGYANMTAAFKGNIDTNSSIPGIEDPSIGVDFKVPRDYFKFGAKIGWKLDPGAPGGFIFEPSFGWSFGIGAGDSIVTRTMEEVSKEIEKKSGSKVLGDVVSSSTQSLLETMAWGIDNLIFVGGPRLSLAVGWSF